MLVLARVSACFFHLRSNTMPGTDSDAKYGRGDNDAYEATQAKRMNSRICKVTKGIRDRRGQLMQALRETDSNCIIIIMARPVTLAWLQL